MPAREKNSPWETAPAKEIFNAQSRPSGKIALYIIASTSLMFSLALAIIAYNCYEIHRKAFYDYSNQLCLSSNAQAAYVIDGDLVERYARSLTVDKEYEEFAAKLDELKSKMNVKYFYILFDNGVPGMYTYIYDAAHSEEFPGEQYALGRNETTAEYEGAAEVLATGRGFEKALYYNEKYGELYYAYFPIFNSSGETVAFVGTDIDIGPLEAELLLCRQNINKILIFSIASFVVIYIFIIRRILMTPMKHIANGALRLAGGNVELLLPPNLVKRADEIGQLGNAFESVSHSITDLISDIERIMQAVRGGRLSERAGLAAYRGDYYRIIEGVNKTLDVVCSHFDAIPEAIAFFDAHDRQILYCNQVMHNFLQLHGLEKNDEHLLTQIFAAKNNKGENIEEELQDFFNKKKGFITNREICLVAADNDNIYIYSLSLFHVYNSADTGQDASSAVQEAGNGNACIMMILTDITTLSRARNDAEQANRAKGDFLSRMSHEMLTPMNAIIGMAYIANGTKDQEKTQHCLKIINEASKHLLAVINDILDMSKIETNKLELLRREFDIKKMLINITNATNSLAENKKQHLQINLHKNVPLNIIGDELRLTQVITNLLTNAIKFSPEGGTITLNIEKISLTDGLVTLQTEVIDNGIGISPEQHSRLFTSFEQADGGINRKYGGTGLGLAICKSIVELMGGHIWFESTIGKGSKFTFTIKVERGTAKPSAELCADANKDNTPVPLSDNYIAAGNQITDYEEFLPVINVADGLSKMMNKKKLYFASLKKFTDSKIADELLISIKEVNFAKTAQVAHALKNVSVNLGLTELGYIATNIEMQAKAGMESNQMAALLDKAAATATNSINRLLESEGIK